MEPPQLGRHVRAVFAAKADCRRTRGRKGHTAGNLGRTVSRFIPGTPDEGAQAAMLPIRRRHGFNFTFATIASPSRSRSVPDFKYHVFELLERRPVPGPLPPVLDRLDRGRYRQHPVSSADAGAGTARRQRGAKTPRQSFPNPCPQRRTSICSTFATWLTPSTSRQERHRRSAGASPHPRGYTVPEGAAECTLFATDLHVII